MAEMNVPSGTPPPNANVTQPSYLDSPVYQSLPASEKDSLEKSYSTNELNARFAVGTGQIPQLIAPKKGVSFKDYLNKRSTTTLDLLHQLSASEAASLSMRRVSSQAAALQALALAEAMQERNQAIDGLQKSADAIAAELKTLLDEMEAQTKRQNELTTGVNAGNEEEKAQFEALSKAYDKYISDLKSIGAVDKGNGQYAIPEESTEKFNEITKTYQQEVSKFNSYWDVRQKQLSDYNAATMAYNQNAEKNNKDLDALIKNNDLTGLQESEKISYQEMAGTRDLSGYAKTIEAPETIKSTPATVNTFPPPSYVKTTGKSGPPRIVSLASYPPQKDKNYTTAIYNKLYESKIGPLDQQIAYQSELLNLLKMREIFHPVEDRSPQPSLNYKPLMQKLLPETEATLHVRIDEKNATILHSAISSIKIEDPSLQEILGGSNLKNLVVEFNPNLTTEQVDQIVDQLLVFSVSQLGNSSLHALFPGLELIYSSLLTLPQDSPALALLFSISFANRIQEMAELGLTEESLETFISKTPELSNLSKDQKTLLTSALNVGQLLVAGKLLETNLGLPGLMAKILPPLISDKPDAIQLKAAFEVKQSRIEVVTKVENHFVDKGYPKETASYLAHTAVQIMEEGPSTPTVSAIPSPNSINVPLLKDSIKSSLLLTYGPTYPIAQADEIANEIVDRALADGPYYTTNQFRTALESNLHDFGLKGNTVDIIRDAIIILPKEIALSMPIVKTVIQIEEEPLTNLESSKEAPPIAPAKETPSISTGTAPLPSSSVKDSPTPSGASQPISPAPQPTPSRRTDTTSPLPPPSFKSTPLPKTAEPIPTESKSTPPPTAETISPAKTETISLTEKHAPSSPTGTISPTSPTGTVSPTPKIGLPPIGESVGPRISRTTTESPTIKPVQFESTSPITSLSQTEVMTIVSKRVYQLLVPQFGTTLAKQVTEEIGKTLFGIPNPKSAADIASPFSLVGVLKNELYHRTAREDIEIAVTSHEDFKETIKETVNLNAFLLKLMDPLAVYTHIGLMYERNDGKQKNIFV